MALTNFTDDVNIISKLDDYPPNDVGMTTSKLRALFDTGSGLIKTFINGSLIPEISNELNELNDEISIVSSPTSAKKAFNAIEAHNKSEVAKLFKNTTFDVTSKLTVNGSPIISSPDCLMYMMALGDSSGNPVIFDAIGTKGGYSPSAGGNTEALASIYSDVAYYPYYINRPNVSDGRYGKAKWRLVNEEYPSGILEYTYADSGVKTAHAKTFAKDDVLYMVFDVSGINDLKYAITLRSSEGTKNYTGGYATSNGQGYISVKDNTTGMYFTITCTSMNQYQVDTSPINATLGLDKTKLSVTSSACSIGLGTDGFGEIGQIVFCMSSGISQAATIGAAIAGLTNWQDKLTASETDWTNFYGDTGDRLTYLTPNQRMKYYLCLQQIRSETYNGYMSAGTPNWPKDFIRDTAWTIYGLSVDGQPNTLSLAKNMADWFAGVDDFAHANSFTVDKKRFESTMNQTDSAATFLMAVGKLYEMSGYDATSLKTVLDVALGYAQTNFVSADGHIAAIHAHDFWDDYVSEITVSLVKYESMVDVLWIVGLEAIAPVYTTLGDTVSAAFCTSTAAALRAKLSDYRNSDGGLCYAIKTDGSLYNSVAALPGTLYAAWLLNDSACANWILNCGRHLFVQHGLVSYPLTHSNATTAMLKEEIWMPYVPIVALIAAQAGDYSLAQIISEQFTFGGLNEYSKISNAEKFVWRSHAYDLPWADAMFLSLVDGLSKLQ